MRPSVQGLLSSSLNSLLGSPQSWGLSKNLTNDLTEVRFSTNTSYMTNTHTTDKGANMNEIDNALHAEAAKNLREVYRFITGHYNDRFKAEHLIEWLGFASTQYAATCRAVLVMNSKKV